MAVQNNWQDVLITSVKEFVKVALLAMIPLLIVGLNTSIDWKAVGVAGAIAFLNALNEFLKKWNAPAVKDYTGIIGQ